MPTLRTPWRRRFVRASRALRLGAVVAGTTLFVGVANVAAQSNQPTSQTPELSQKISDEIGKIRPQLAEENPNFTELLRTVDAIIAKHKPTGFDLAYISQIKANLLIRSGKQLEAIKPIEDTLAGDYFPAEIKNGMTLALAQLYMQEAGITDNEAVRKDRLTKSRARLDDWLKHNKEPLLGAPEMSSYIDAVSIYANCLYFLGEFKESYAMSQKLVRLSITPNDQAWVLLFAAQQEAGKNAEAAETFELFIRKFPEKKDYWMQLTQAYLSSDQTLRAILTYQRAQAYGFMNSPNDYLNIFGLYYRMEEYSRASQLLEGWINEKKVEDNEDNWELVSVCFQNMRREDRVRTILDSARKRFKTGNLDFQLAQYLWYDGNYKGGLEAAEAAWKKGGLRKPGKAALFLATANYEQRDFKRAKEFLDIAKKSGDVEQREIKRAEDPIEDALKTETERNAAATAPAKTGA